MIPVLGIPILNQPELLYRLLESLDTEIRRIVVVDNGGVVDPECLPSQAKLITPGHNLGVAASWNLIIKSSPKAPWWVISNFDLVFAPGDLDRLTDHMETSLGGNGIVALLGTFSVFALDQVALSKAGWFDENFHPAYFEDNDFDYRCRLAGVPMIGLPAGLRHDISSTLKGSELFQSGNGRTFPRNADYYRTKWGGKPREEQYSTPFNEGGDVRSWRLDIDRLATLSWQ